MPTYRDEAVVLRTHQLGEADRIVDVEVARAYAAAVPGARLEVLPRTGHLPQLESPDALLALLGR